MQMRCDGQYSQPVVAEQRVALALINAQGSHPRPGSVMLRHVWFVVQNLQSGSATQVRGDCIEMHRWPAAGVEELEELEELVVVVVGALVEVLMARVVGSRVRVVEPATVVARFVVHVDVVVGRSFGSGKWRVPSRS